MGNIHPYSKNIAGWLIAMLLLHLPLILSSQIPEVNISIDIKKRSAPEILDELSLQTGYFFTYNSDLIPGAQEISLELENIPLEAALDSILGDPDLQYRLIDKNIVIFKENPQPKNTADKEPKEIRRIEGTVTDRASGEELPFATILIHGTNRGIISNLQGEFSLVIPEKHDNPILIASMMGYQNTYFHLSQESDEKINIRMEKELISLQEVIIRYQNPSEILENTINRITDNYLSEPSLMKAYFREYVQKNEDFITFSEAVIDIAKVPYSVSFRSDNVKILKGRKVQDISPEDSVLLKIQSGVNSSLQLDIIKSRPDFLQPDFAEYYRLEFQNIVSYRNQQVYIIGFAPKEKFEYPLYEGKLYINKNDFALVAADFHVAPEDLRKNPERFLVKKSPSIRVRPQKARYHVEYRRKEDKYHLSMVQAEVSFRLRKKRQWFSSLYSIGIEMAITEVEPGLIARIPRKERLRPGTILSDQEFSYDPSFWGDYNIIQPEASLKDALERMGYEWERMGE